MALVQDIVNKVKSQLSTPTTPSGFVPSAPSPAPEVPASTSNALSEAISSGIGGVSSSYGGWDQPAEVNSLPISSGIAPAVRGITSSASTPRGISSTAPVGIGTSTGKPSTPATTDIPKGIFGMMYGDPSDEANSAYEDYFAQNGMTEQDLKDIRGRGSWGDVLMHNPATQLVTHDLGKNPFLDVSIEDGRLVNKRERDPNTLPDTRTTIGDIHAIDNGLTMDYDHVTAPRATGTAMQRYSEMGMGGRKWFEYDPYATYMKGDEASQHGFRAYLPDETSMANMLMAQALDKPGDIAGMIGSSRELNPITGEYKIKFDVDGDEATKDDVLSLSGSDWDYRATPYVNNIDRLFRFDPMSLLRMPANGLLHGAPVSPIIKENAIPDASGKTKYVYGDLVDSGYDLVLTYANGDVARIPSNEWTSWQSSDGLVLPQQYDGDIVSSMTDENLHLTFSDGQDVHVPKSVYDGWVRPDGSMYIPDATYVPVREARGFLPDDLETLNANAIREGVAQNAPVLFIPDMVMDDGTRLTWDQVQRIYYDQEAEDNPSSVSDDGISYDFGPLGLAKPRRLTGEILNDDMSVNWGDLLNNAWDFTAGSIPISLNAFAWPLSATEAYSKSVAGIDPNKYDALTGSDRYISADLDESGELRPTYTPIQQIANIAGNALVPLTEQLAGPLSGHSAIEALSGELPLNPSTREVLQNFLLGMLGEGMEEIVGNVTDEVTGQGEAAYGDVVTPEGERLLDDQGRPVVDESGNYRFTDAEGNPYTYMTDQVGHIYRDPNTSLMRRFGNFLSPNELGNAFLGGSLVDATMQLPREVIPSLVGSPGLFREPRMGSIQRDAIRRRQGGMPYVETERDRMRAAMPQGFDVTQGDLEIDPDLMSLFNN